MTAIENLLRRYVFPADSDNTPVSVGEFILKGIGKLFNSFTSYDSSFGSNEELGDFDFKYAGKYNGKDVYAGSNNAIARLLNENGDPGHKGGKINYGAAFRDRIYVLDELLYGAAENGKADPLSNLRLRYVLDHELAHLEGFEERDAHSIAQKKTGLTFARYE